MPGAAVADGNAVSQDEIPVERLERQAELGEDPDQTDPEPAARLGNEHVMGVYLIWKFAKNKEAARKYVVDQQLGYRETELHLIAAKLKGTKLKDEKYLFLGAGSAGIGLADLLCSALVGQGISEPWKIIQSLLGHAHLSTTLDTYLRVVNVEKARTADGAYEVMRSIIRGN